MAATTTDVADRLSEYILAESPRDDIALTAQTNLLEDWFVDSLMILNIVAFIEGEFGIRFRRADINAATFQTIETLAAYVHARQDSDG